MSNEQSLPLILKELKLPVINQHWKAFADAAQEESWTYSKYLSELTELEMVARVQKRIKRHTLESKLPAGKTLDAFDFKKARSINAAQIHALAENTDWVRNTDNLIIFGASGVGKTHIAAAIGYALIQHGIRALFTQTNALVQKLQQARRDYKLNEYIARLGRYPLLILDDIGYVKKNEAETSVLFELIADRYETSSIIITANQPFSEWGSIFPDNMMAVAAIDRLVHHATIINIKGESFRKKHSKNTEQKEVDNIK